MRSARITTRINRMMPLPGMILGLVLLIIGLTVLGIAGIILILLAGIVLTGQIGLELNLNNRTYRAFYAFFGLRFGKWLDLKPYSNIIIMNRNILSNRNIGLANISYDVETHCDVFLANANHRKRLLLQRCENRKNADFAAVDWAMKLDLEYVPYNPQISASTRARRYRR